MRQVQAQSGRLMSQRASAEFPTHRGQSLRSPRQADRRDQGLRALATASPAAKTSRGQGTHSSAATVRCPALRLHGAWAQRRRCEQRRFQRGGSGRSRRPSAKAPRSSRPSDRASFSGTAVLAAAARIPESKQSSPPVRRRSQRNCCAISQSREEIERKGEAGKIAGRFFIIKILRRGWKATV